jgi:hypothetical protein
MSRNPIIGLKSLTDLMATINGDEEAKQEEPYC